MRTIEEVEREIERLSMSVIIAHGASSFIALKLKMTRLAKLRAELAALKGETNDRAG